jgi:stearoyl-CoA desaturase (delta-9 desaturase)
MWGSQRFRTGDSSKNSFWVAMLSFGEGWHNNHHAHPQSPRHGLTWYEIDMNWYGIAALRLLNLAWDLKLPGFTQPGFTQPGFTRPKFTQPEPAAAEKMRESSSS